MQPSPLTAPTTFHHHSPIASTSQPRTDSLNRQMELLQQLRRQLRQDQQQLQQDQQQLRQEQHQLRQEQLRQVQQRDRSRSPQPSSSRAVADSAYKQASDGDQFKCGQCDTIFKTVRELLDHRANCFPHDIPLMETLQNEVIHRQQTDTAFGGIARYIRFTPIQVPVQPIDFFPIVRPYLEEVLELLVGGCNECRVQTVLAIRILQVDPTSGEIIRSELMYISAAADIASNPDFLDIAFAHILHILEEFIQNGSNWFVESVDSIDLRITKYFSVPNKRGHSFIDLPPRLKAKCSVVNVDNNTEYNCFLYAVLSILHYDDIHDHRNRAGKYQDYIHELNFGDLTFPITAQDIPRFEKLNPGLFINLIEWQEENKLCPMRILRAAGHPRQSATVDQPEGKLINILTFEIPGKAPHYVGVTNLNRLLNNRVGALQSYHGSKHCERCFQPFRNIRSLTKHRESCYTGEPVTLVPEADKLYRKFERYQAIQRLPYVIYADIECFLEKTDGEQDNSLNTKRESRHRAAAISFLLVPHPEMRATPLPKQYAAFTGESCVEDGMKYLTNLSKKVYKWNKENANQPAILSKRQIDDHMRAQECYVCGDQFKEYRKGEGNEKIKVKEHDHLTGEYRGAACQQCNGKMRLRNNFLPVFFHNFKNYDSHVICAEGLGKIKGWDVSVIAQTSEKYTSVNATFMVETPTQRSKGVYMTIGFRDSFQFLAMSLDNLVKNLSAEELIHTRQLFPTEELFRSVALSKGVFPYTYFDSPARMTETALPSRQHFFNDLEQEECSQERYAKAQQVWTDCECSTLEDYMLLYLRCDVYQLADVFERFRELTLEGDGLDPAYYYTLPGLVWDSAFKMTGARVDLLDSVDKYNFVEGGIRGGMTFINQHHVEANNARIPESFNPVEPEVDLLYVDANNLYGNALSQKLPEKDFKWMEEKMTAKQIMDFDYEGEIGHIFEVDLVYPRELQDRTTDLPFAPEKMIIPERCLSDNMREQWKRLNGDTKKAYRGSQKLLLTHWDKYNYVIHGKLLQYYLQQGMELIQIHRTLQFTQSSFFEPYITYNSRKRQSATSEFEKEYYKLRNNALFGKTMENLRRRKKFKLCTSADDLTTYTSRPEFLSFTIFHENLVGVNLAKDQVVLNKPIAIGQAVLDLSKLIMYDLYYGKLKTYATEIGGSISVMGGDTDSLFLKTVDMKVDTILLPRMVEEGLLDTSNYPKSNPLYSEKFKARLGCIKDESRGFPFKEWILLRPKAYSMQSATNGNEGKDVKRAKGVRRATLRKEITHATFREAYMSEMCFSHNQRRIGSNRHQLYNFQYKKRTLSFFEDKRCWVRKNFSLPFGNHKLQSERPALKRLKNLPRVIEPKRRRRMDGENDGSADDDDEGDDDVNNEGNANVDDSDDD